MLLVVFIDHVRRAGEARSAFQALAAKVFTAFSMSSEDFCRSSGIIAGVPAKWGVIGQACLIIQAKKLIFR
jgi:hypothetical protein